MFNKEKPVEINIDKEKCTKCGVCTEICTTYLKKDAEGFPVSRNFSDKKNILGCIQCGNCMMLCPKGAIEVKGEDIGKDHLREIGRNIANYESLNALFLKRRSCRKFTDQEVEKDIIEKILQSAATAAVSIPPSEVKVLVIQGKEKVKELAGDVIKSLSKFTKISPIMLPLVRIFAGKSTHKMFKEFILPLSKTLIKGYKEGQDWLFYDAPAVIMFYGSPYSDKEDWLIAATQATLAAEALGLGTCFIGTAGAMFQNNPKLREKYGIAKEDKIGSAFILGYPEIKFKKAFQRNFKEVTYID